MSQSKHDQIIQDLNTIGGWDGVAARPLWVGSVPYCSKSCPFMIGKNNVFSCSRMDIVFRPSTLCHPVAAEAMNRLFRVSEIFMKEHD